MARTALVVAMTVAILAGGLLWPAVPVAAGVTSSQTDIAGPAGSGEFGTMVLALPSGNILVTDPSYDSGAITDVGAVYLYNGATGALITTLTGSTAGDQVGLGGVTALENGNYVVLSPEWNNGGTADAGAVTWGNGTTGISGAVSSANSLVGSTANDWVGSDVTALTNGNYVVLSPDWNNGGAADAGAATWGNGTTGVSGVVSAANSLVGTTASDQVGTFGATALVNGNYVVCSPNWHNGAVVDAGAATWGNGATGSTGAVTASNSLVGGTDSDYVCSSEDPAVTALANGNYVVFSPDWDNGAVADAGAATWGNGTSGITGVVTTTNSLVGSAADDYVGVEVTALGNGNYVVCSPYWDGTVADAGAATWGNGTTGITGVVTTTNSLVGSTAEDRVGWGATALSNGNYVVESYSWDNEGVDQAGAATWGNGTTGTSGVVSSANSLVGTTASDQVGTNGVTVLGNGNYVVCSPNWDGTVAQAGAATWGNGATGSTGEVGASNSLVGSTAEDQVGWGATALSNGDYVVETYYWHNAGVDRAGAATWGNGTTGTSGVVSASNSLVGSKTLDSVGSSVTALSKGNYVVGSSTWDNGGVSDAGAVTWGNGTTGVTGAVSASNSLVGGTANDQVGSNSGTALANGHYVVFSPYWDNGAVNNAGAVTWGNGMLGARGTVTAENSVRGTAAGGGPTMVFDYDYTNDQLVVGRPADNKVTLFKPPCYGAFLPLVLKKAS